MEVQTTVTQVVTTLSSRNEGLKRSIHTYHYWVRNDNDHHVSKTDRCQMSRVVHVRDEKHANLVLYLNQEKAQNRWDWKAHELFDGVRDFHNFFWRAVIGIELKTRHTFDVWVFLLNNYQLIGRCDSLGKEIVF